MIAMLVLRAEIELDPGIVFFALAVHQVFVHGAAFQ
jgi:hypothetical protein